MSRRTLFLICCVLAVYVGVVGRITYEDLTSEQPAYAQVDRNCGSFTSQADAQDFYDADPSDPSNLDADDDGQACEDSDFAGTGASGDSEDDSAATNQYSNDETTTVRKPTDKPRRDDSLLRSSGAVNGPLPLMRDGTCPPEFPVKIGDTCNARP